MPDYAAMYRKLFAAQADAIDGLREITNKLIRVHQQVEELHISDSESDIATEKSDEARTSEFPREN